MHKWTFFSDLRALKLSDLRRDLMVAITLALLTIPQAVAYSLLAGLPLSAGIYSAIFGTLVCSTLCAHSKLMAGPTTAIAILVQTTISAVMMQYYPDVTGLEKEAIIFGILIQMALITGLLQVLLSFFNVGKALQFVSRPVILGYFTGLGIAVITQQLFYFFGLGKPQTGVLIVRIGSLFSQLSQFHLMSFGVGLFSLSLFFLLKKKAPKFPAPLFILSLAAVISYLVHQNFSSAYHVFSLNHITHEVFRFSFTYPKIDLLVLQSLFLPSFAISFLGILESLTVSKAAKNETFNINQEVFSIGMSNIFLSFIRGALPSSASMSRSMMNYQLGGKTRLAGLFSCFFVWGIFYYLWPFVSWVPLASLSALVILSVSKVFDLKQIKFCFRATREDALVFSVTFLLCFFIRLDVAFILGMVISIASYLRKAAEPEFVEYAFNRAGRLSLISPDQKAHRKVRIIGVGGELFFGVVDILQNALQVIAKDPHVHVIVLRLNGVYHVDASMCYAIMRFHDQLEKSNRYLVISGLNEKTWKIFRKSKLMDQIGKDNFFLGDEARPQLSTWKACLRARELIQDK